MSTKEELVTNISSWLKLDEEMKLLQTELKERREKKKKITALLVETMKTNEIDCFDMSEGNIIYSKTKVKSTITKSYLMSCLGNFFKENPDVEASDVTKYIMESRETKINESIRHKPVKK